MITDIDLDVNSMGWSEVTTPNGCDNGRIIVASIAHNVPGPGNNETLRFNFDFSQLIQRGIIDRIVGAAVTFYSAEEPQPIGPATEAIEPTTVYIDCASGFSFGFAKIPFLTPLFCDSSGRVSISMSNEATAETATYFFKVVFTNFEISTLSMGVSA